MTQTHRQYPERRAARAIAVARANSNVAGITTLILSGLLVLLSGAVWTQLT